MQWLNEPASWQRDGDLLKVSVDPGTDFWRETGYGYIHDNGHVYGEVVAGDLDVSVRVRVSFSGDYDQAGLMLRTDERTWLKTGLEFFEGRPRLSTVLTLGQSSWMVADLPEDADEITLRASRRQDAVEVRYAVDGGPSELAALVFLPPAREVFAGVMCAAPDSGGFSVSFRDLRIAGRSWGGPPEAGGWAEPGGGLDEPGPGDGWPEPPVERDWAGQAARPNWPDADPERRAAAPERGQARPERAPDGAAASAGIPRPAGPADPPEPEPPARAGRTPQAPLSGSRWPGPPLQPEWPAGDAVEPESERARSGPPWDPAPDPSARRAPDDPAADWKKLSSGLGAPPALSDEEWKAEAAPSPDRVPPADGVPPAGARLPSDPQAAGGAPPAAEPTATSFDLPPVTLPPATLPPADEQTQPVPAADGFTGADAAPRAAADASGTAPNDAGERSRKDPAPAPLPRRKGEKAGGKLRGRSKQPDPSAPAPVDPADEWISLLTADPGEE